MSVDSVRAIQARLPVHLSAEEFYGELELLGFEYGSQFRQVRELWRGRGEALGRVSAAIATEGTGGYFAHPCVLDASMHVIAGALPPQWTAGEFVIESIGSFVQSSACPATLWSHATLQEQAGRDAKSVVADLEILNDAGAVIAQLSQVRIRRMPAQDDRPPSSLEHALVRMAWVESPVAQTEADPASDADPFCDVVVFNDGPIGERLSELLAARGRPTVSLRMSPERTAEQWDANLRNALPGGRRLGRLLYLVSMAGTPDACAGARSALAALEAACRPLLSLAQALMAHPERAPAKLCVVTQGTQAVLEPTEVTAPHVAAVWGLVRALRLEMPSLRCQLIDLPDATIGSTTLLAAELAADPPDADVAFRGQTRYEARLQPLAWRDAGTGIARLSSEGCYVITGGLGALGLDAARELARGGAGHLLLIGRRPPDAAALRIIAGLERWGTRVTVHAADVSCANELRAALQSATAPIRGVIHAAGVLDDGVVPMQTWERFLAVLRPKVEGGWNLYELLQSSPLDFFVCYSSIVSLVGNAGQASYAAANAAVDAFAHYARAAGSRSVAINWSGFTGGGMGAHVPDRQLEERLRASGIEPINARDGARALVRLAAATLPLVAVLPANLTRLREKLRASPSLQRLLGGTGAAGLAAERFGGGSEVMEKVRELKNPESGRELLSAFVCAKVGELLQVPDSTLDCQRPLSSFGLDSVAAIQLHRLLRAELGLDMPVAALFDDMSIADIARRAHCPS